SDQGGHHADWAPWSGQSPLTLQSVLVSASRGLTEAETRALAPSFDLSSVAAQPHVMEGATIERFDVQRSAARRILASAIEATAAAHAQGWIPGTRYRNLKTA